MGGGEGGGSLGRFHHMNDINVCQSKQRRGGGGVATKETLFFSS